MEIRAQQQTVGDVVGLGAEIRCDVRGLKDIEDIATGDGAAAVVGGQQSIAELALASAGTDFSKDLLAGVLGVRGVEGLVVSFVRG